MSQLVSSLSALASSPATTGALDVTQLGSTGYNLYNQYQNQQYQNTLRSDAQNPAKVTALAQQYTQPLNAGLTAAVNNQTQAQLAQAGLSESPEISQTVLAQALAPYIQNNQQQGYNLALQALNLGGGAIPPGQQQQNSLSTLAKAFSQLGGPQQVGQQTPGTLPSAQTYASMNAPSQTYDPYAGLGSEPAYSPIDLSTAYTPDYGSYSDADAE